MKEKNEIVVHKIISIVILLSIITCFSGVLFVQHRNNVVNDNLKENLLENNKSVNMYNMVYNPNNQLKNYYDLNNSEKINYNNYLINKNDNDLNSILLMLVITAGGLILLVMGFDYYKQIKTCD